MKQMHFEFQYEPSAQHTLESFKARQAIRAAEAKKDQQAFTPEEIKRAQDYNLGCKKEGSVNATKSNVIHLRDESGFGECVVPAELSIPHDGCGACGIMDCVDDVYDQVKGG